jgi:hypothetical protein
MPRYPARLRFAYGFALSFLLLVAFTAGVGGRLCNPRFEWGVAANDVVALFFGDLFLFTIALLAAGTLAIGFGSGAMHRTKDLDRWAAAGLIAGPLLAFILPALLLPGPGVHTCP